MNVDDRLSYGALAYTAYGISVHWVNHMNKPMPKWDDLPAKIRDAWHAAADAVRRGEL